jgi:LemA protein
MSLIPIIIIVVLLLIIVGLYNTLVGRKNQVENAFGTIDAMLKKRFDLIPNLVETVKQYMTYEQDTLTKIVELRNSIQAQPNMPAQERIGMENQLTGLLSGLRLRLKIILI